MVTNMMLFINTFKYCMYSGIRRKEALWDVLLQEIKPQLFY